MGTPPCFMCGDDRSPAILAPAGPVCGACALVCVEVVQRQLAERVAFERMPATPVFPFPRARRIAA